MRVIGFPQIYKQGPNLLDTVGEDVKLFGKKALIVSDPYIQKVYGGKLQASLEFAGIASVFSNFSGQTSPTQLELLKKDCIQEKCDVAIGFGGGKSQDAAKSLKIDCNIPVIIIPTSASNDAATSRLSITYTDEGKFIGPKIMKTNPEAVLVDTSIILKAPVRFLSAGIGDALATYFEAMQCKASRANNFFHGEPTEVSLAVAKLCYEVIWEKGEQAIIDLKNGILSKDLDDVIEANILLSGIGFEGCGVAAAHGISLGFSLIDEITGLHGEEVAVGLISQFVLENRPKDYIFRVFEFYRKVNLPISLFELGLKDKTEDKLRTIAKFGSKEGGRTRNMNCEISEQIVFDAIIKAERYADEYIESHR